MTEKNIQTRHIQKHGVERVWKKAKNFVPEKGELIIYDIDENYSYERFKIGDGTTRVGDLPFAILPPNWSQSNETAIDYIKNKPFGDNSDGTVTKINNKYLEPFELQAGDVNEFLPSYTAANIFNSGLSAFNIVVSTDEATYNAFLENTKPMVIVYDGVEYICEVHTLQGTKYLGNGVSLGGAGNNEPFAIMCRMSNTDSGNTYCWLVVSTVDTASTEHTVRVYQSAPDKWILKETSLPEQISAETIIVNELNVEEELNSKATTEYVDNAIKNITTGQTGSGLEEIEVGTGLKVSEKVDNKQTIAFDEEVVFFINCN